MLKIGWSKRDISTEEPVNISGQFHARISRGVLDPIMLTSLVIENGKDIVIFLSGDFVSARDTLDLIREKVRTMEPEIPGEKILFNVTHTHCGPDLTQDNNHLSVPHEGFEIYPTEKYIEFMTTSAAEAVIEAYHNREDGSLSYGYGYAVVAHHRRPVYKDDQSTRPGAETTDDNPFIVDGHAKMYGPTNDEMFIGYEGNIDHYVNLLYTFDKTGNLTGAIINVPCPSQNSEIETLLTADYWNEVRLKIKEKYGDIFILPQCAAAGDLSPRTLHYKEAEARRYRLKYADVNFDERVWRPDELYNRMDIAERIYEAFNEVLSWAQKEKITEAKIVHTVKTMELPARCISETQYTFAREKIAELERIPFVHTGDVKADFKKNTEHMSKINRFSDVISRYEEQQKKKTATMEAHIIRIGDIAFASNAYELFIDFQHQIQARSPFLQTFIVQLCAQPSGYHAGYLATKKAVENHGYSATIYCNEISSEGGEVLVEETLNELYKLY